MGMVLAHVGHQRVVGDPLRRIGRMDYVSVARKTLPWGSALVAEDGGLSGGDYSHMKVSHVRVRGLASVERVVLHGDAVLHGGTWEGEVAAGEWLAPGIKL
jgi:hypothetical protein